MRFAFCELQVRFPFQTAAWHSGAQAGASSTRSTRASGIKPPSCQELALLVSTFTTVHRWKQEILFCYLFPAQCFKRTVSYWKEVPTASVHSQQSITQFVCGFSSNVKCLHFFFFGSIWPVNCYRLSSWETILPFVATRQKAAESIQKHLNKNLIEDFCIQSVCTNNTFLLWTRNKQRNLVKQIRALKWYVSITIDGELQQKM